MQIKTCCAVPFLLFAATSWCQTPPIQLKTAEIKVPAPLEFPKAEFSEIGNQPLSIDEAIKIALRRQPDIGTAQANLLAQQGRTEQSRASLKPQFSLGAGFTSQHYLRNNSGSSPNRVTGSTNVQQLVYDFGLIRNQVRQQVHLESASKLNLKRTTQLVTLNVRLAFYDLLQGKADVTSSELNVTNRERQLGQAQALADSGLGAPADVVQAKTNLADAAISLTLARGAYFDAQIALAERLGVDPSTPITPAGAKEQTVDSEGDLRKLLPITLAHRADLLSARDQASAAKDAVSVARLGNAPNVTLNAGLNGQGDRDFLETQQSSVSLSINWPVGDGGLTVGKIKEAVGNERAAQENVRSVRNQAIKEVSQAFVDLQSALQRVTLAQAGQNNADQLVQIAEGKYRGGIGQFLDITTAQDLLFASNRNLTQAQVDVERARARLRTAIGLS